MKLFKSIIIILATLFSFISCENELIYEPGQAENADTEGVFFPLQSDYANEFNGLEFVPEDDTFLEVTISRANIETSVDAVPFEIEASEEGIFTLSDIVFAEGQTETTAILDFSPAAIGIEYSCNIILSDPKYVAVYGNKRISLSVSLVRASWKKLVGPNGETKGKWREDMLSLFSVNGFAETDIEIYQREDIPGIFRIDNIYTPEFIGACVNRSPDQLQNNWREASIVINASNPDKVWIAQQDMGLILSNDEGWMSMASHTPEGHPSFVDADKYGTYKDGVITFPQSGIVCFLDKMQGNAYVENKYSMFRVMLPGVRDFDHSCEIEVKDPVNGSVNIDIALGSDVDRIEYAYFEGNLSSDEANLKSMGMDESSIVVEILRESVNFNKNFTKTGLYTIVANIYGANDILIGYSFDGFGYIASGDTHDVVISMGIDLTNKYSSEGLTKENSAFPWIYGKDIINAKYIVSNSKAVQGMSDEKLIEEVEKFGYSFEEDAIDSLNKNGYSFRLTDLIPATSYTLLVSAFNGYINQVFKSEVKTEGNYNILNDYFIFNDLTPIADKNNLLKKWDVWAVNHNDKENPNRQKMGTWTFSENTEDQGGRDMINLDGITLKTAYKATTTWEYYDGYFLARKSQKLGNFNIDGSSVFLKFIPINWQKGLLFEEDEYTMIGGMVDDGCMALVSNPYVDTDADVTGILIGVYSDEEYTAPTSNLSLYSNILLRDPAIKGASSEKISAYKNELYELSEKMKNPNNYVELRGTERVKALIDEMNRNSIRNIAPSSLKFATMPDAKQIKL